MGQKLTRQQLKEEIESSLGICFLSLIKDDNYNSQSHQILSNNLSIACTSQGSVEYYFKILGDNKENSYINDYYKLKENSLLLKYIKKLYEESTASDTVNNIVTAINSNTTNGNVETINETITTPTSSNGAKEKEEKKDFFKDYDKEDEEEERKKNSIHRNKYKNGTFESIAYQGENIYLQIIDLSEGTNNGTLRDRFRFFERVLNTSTSTNGNGSFKPQPNEYLTSWEYFDELHSTPIFYDCNPLYNMINSDNYTIQEKSFTLDQPLTQETLIKLVLQSLSTYISPLPNSIHFNDSNIPPSVDYSQPNLLKIHPNILPIIEILNTVTESNSIVVLQRYYKYSLEILLRYSSLFLQKNHKNSNFIIYQLAQTISFLHDKEIPHANLTPSSIFLNEKMWLGLTGFTFPNLPLYQSPSMDSNLDQVVIRWVNGEISNYKYLLTLNQLAHRKMGDHLNHPVMPWVIDFTKNPSQSISTWRDLTKTKYRLNKGDEQLDFQFANTPNFGPSQKPHHISDVLSELTYYSYLARRTPIPLLRRFVRTNYEPNEYPNSMERLYRWTPDECIPEFFTDPSIFKSIHPDMPDLHIPEWASSPEEFIQIHMQSLESDQVSRHLHAWIDLTFGYLLSGEAAIKSKNVALIDNQSPRNSGIVQLFHLPHPKKNVYINIDKQQQPINYDDYIKFNKNFQVNDQNISSNNNLETIQQSNSSINNTSNGVNLFSNVLIGSNNTNNINNSNNNSNNSQPNTTNNQINTSTTNLFNNSNISNTPSTPNNSNKDSNNVPNTPNTPYQAKSKPKSNISTSTGIQKKEESSKSFSKFLPSLIQTINSTINNAVVNIPGNTINNSGNTMSKDEFLVIRDEYVRNPPNVASNPNLMHSKSDDTIKRSTTSSFSTKTTSVPNTPSIFPLDPPGLMSPIQSPQSSTQGLMSPVIQKDESNRPGTPTTVIGSSGDLPITQIIEPFPSYLEFDYHDRMVADHQLSQTTNINQPGQPNTNNQGLNGINYDLFMENLYSCESLSTFSNSIQKLIPIYKPLEYVRPKYSHLISYLENIKGPDDLELHKANDLFAIGCIIAEFYQTQPLFTSQSLLNHFQNPTNVISPTSPNLPRPIKDIVDRLVDPNPQNRMKPKELLASNIFPMYFKQMYHFLCHFHSLEPMDKKLSFTLTNIGSVTSLPNEAMDIILPFVMELFEHPSTMVSALIDLLDPLSQRLGPTLSQIYLLPFVIKLYQKHEDHLLQCHLIQVPLIDMIVTRFGRDTFIHHLLPFLIDSVKTNPKDNPNHDMLTLAMIKISKILGVPLTIRHIMYPLLESLTKPHLQHLNEPLVAIASNLGEQVIIKFYFPAIFTLIQKHSSKQAATRSESIPCTLLSLLQELILLVKPALVLRSLLMESTQLAALLLNPSNPSLLLPLAETLLRIAGRIGVDNTKQYILKYLQQFFTNYPDLYKFSSDSSYSYIEPESNRHLLAIYSPEMTYHLYHKLAKIIGYEIMRVEISDNALIEHIMTIYMKENHIKDPNISHSSSIPPYVSDDGLYEDLHEQDLTLDHKISSTYSLDDLDYSMLQDSNANQYNEFNLEGDVVYQFREHNASVRSLAMSPSETIFASGSKDSLVKIWSLDSSRSLNTYNGHMHTIHSVSFLSSLVASCDTTSIQVWDPESKVKVNVFYEPNNSITSFEPLNSKHILASSQESSISFYDLLVGQETNQWILSYSAANQQIRTITTSNDHLIPTNSNTLLQSSTSSFPTWIAGGTSTGSIYILDTRTGTILDSWKTHDGPIIKLIGHGTRYLVSCSEKSVYLWDLQTSPPTVSKMWKGFKESISALSLNQNDLFAAYGQKISTMSCLQDNDTSFQRVEGIKINSPKPTNIHSMSYLPLHNLVLTGNDDGSIKIIN